MKGNRMTERDSEFTFNSFVANQSTSLYEIINIVAIANAP